MHILQGLRHVKRSGLPHCLVGEVDISRAHFAEAGRADALGLCHVCHCLGLCDLELRLLDGHPALCTLQLCF